MKLWGGRFESGPSDVFERFSGSLHFDKRLLDPDVRGTVTVSLQNLPFEFFFLRGLSRFANIQIPAMTTPITGEDLSSGAPAF